MSTSAGKVPNYLLPESIFFITPIVHEGTPCFMFQLADNTHVMYPMPCEVDRVLMWENLHLSLSGNIDFVLFIDCFVNIRHLESTRVETSEDASEFCIVFQFPNNLEFIRTYVDVAQMHENYARFLDVGKRLKSLDVPKISKTLLN